MDEAGRPGRAYGPSGSKGIRDARTAHRGSRCPRPAARLAPPPPGLSSALTYVGHSTLLVELGATRMLTDPVLGSGIGHIRRTAPPPRRETLGSLDAVLISHAHHDHLDRASLRQVARGCPAVAPRGCATLLRRSGIGDVMEVDAGDRVSIGGIEVEAVPATHDGRRYPISGPVAALGYLLEGTARVYFAGDTDIFPEMAELSG